jgi:enoyl-CoA hydratase/carnithine racemase
MTYREAVTTHVDDGVLEIALNRPDRLNAWNLDLCRRLYHALHDEAGDDHVRVVVLRGEGRGFSTGAEVQLLGSDDIPDGAALSRLMHDLLNPLITRIRELPKPVIAALHGPTAGIAVGLALACDFVIAADDASLLLPFARLGLMPDGAAPLLLSRSLGHIRATELMSGAQPLLAPTALAWGLITETSSAPEVLPRARELAHELAQGSPEAFAETKRAVNRSLFHDLRQHLHREAVDQGRLLDSVGTRVRLAAAVSRTRRA